MIKYVGDTVNYSKRNAEHPGQGVVKKRTVHLNPNELVNKDKRKVYSVWCTYTELCWLRNLLYYRREKLGLEDKTTRFISMAGTEESLLELIGMNPKKKSTLKTRKQWTGLESQAKNENWDTFD